MIFYRFFSETTDEAFDKLMEALLNQILQTESPEQLGASNYEHFDYSKGTQTRSLITHIRNFERLKSHDLRGVDIVISDAHVDFTSS